MRAKPSRAAVDWSDYEDQAPSIECFSCSGSEGVKHAVDVLNQEICTCGRWASEQALEPIDLKLESIHLSLKRGSSGVGSVSLDDYPSAGDRLRLPSSSRRYRVLESRSSCSQLSLEGQDGSGAGTFRLLDPVLLALVVQPGRPSG